MFFYACCYGKDVRVKDDVIGVKVQPVHQQVVRSLADGYLVLCTSGLGIENVVKNNFFSCLYTARKGGGRRQREGGIGREGGEGGGGRGNIGRGTGRERGRGKGREGGI